LGIQPKLILVGCARAGGVHFTIKSRARTHVKNIRKETH
jgi:hypothetical protein